MTHPQLPVTSVPKNPPRTLRWYSSTSMPQRSAHEAPRFHIDLEWSGMPVSIILKSYQINLNIFKSCIKNIISCLLSRPLFGKISGPNLTCDFSFAGPDTPTPLVPHMFLLGVDPADQPYAVKAFHVMTMNCFEFWDYIQTKHIL